MKDEGTPSGALLPEDGTIIRVSPWRRQLLWLGAALLIFINFSVVVQAIHIGRPIALVPVAVCVLATVIAFRIPMSGFVLEADGVRARSVWRNYFWRWDEIDRFELRERGEPRRLKIHLCDGSRYGFSGFFARSTAQEERGRSLLVSLEERLKSEQLKG